MFQLFVEMLEALGYRGGRDIIPDLLIFEFRWGKAGNT